MDSPIDTITELEHQIKALKQERDAAVGREKALAQVLDAINRSAGDPVPVFKTILTHACALCEAAAGSLLSFDGEQVRALATHGLDERHAALLRQPRRSGGFHDRLRRGERYHHLADARAPEVMPGDERSRAFIDEANVRTALWVPMRKDDGLVGIIGVHRHEVRPFSNQEIALLENFAAQAVIAIENARLITEQREALEQQTATAEVLRVINASPGDLGPVFDAMLDKAHRICGAAMGALAIFDGTHFRAVATRGYTARHDALIRQPFLPNIHHRALLRGERFAHLLDVRVAPPEDNAISRSVVENTDMRTNLTVPLRKDAMLVGFISAWRTEVRAFSEKEIALLENFAAQAVIAMESARLLGELRQRTTDLQESLERQTATAEVLEVINASPGNLIPVFDAMLDRAMRLCDTAFGSFAIYDGDSFLNVAWRGVAPELIELFRTPVKPVPGMILWRLMHGEDVVQIADIKDSDVYRSGGRRVLVDIGGARTQLVAALRKDGKLLGAINLFRQEVRPFSGKQLELLRNFAAQAVIAMENARLLTEQLEALEQQTAMAEVLRVINTNPGNVTPAFDAMLEKALRLCDAAFGGLYTYDGEAFHPGATQGMPREVVAIPSVRATPETTLYPITRGEPVVHTLDLADDEVYRSGRSQTRNALVELAGARTQLLVALRAGEVLLGVFMIYRQHVMPFTERQIALVQNFAAQAVIAIENARLLTEQREALERQTAVTEVLQVINASSGNLAPVFDAVLANALRLCGAASGALTTYDGERFHAAAHRGVPPEYAAYRERNPPTAVPGGGTEATLRIRRPQHFLDVTEHELYRAGNPTVRAIYELGGIRTILTVPLVKGDDFLGYISIHRQEVRAFSDKQIALLEGFAAQAVIAMENARLLTEQREALERQTATAEVLGVINANPGNLTPVFDAILQKAHSLCGAAKGALATFDGEHVRSVATRGISESFARMLREPRPRLPDSPLNRLVNGASVFQIADCSTDTHPMSRAAAEIEGIRTILFVPLRRDGALLGMISAYRQEVRPFSDRQIVVLQNFAAQSVIAMENARLLTEQREALERQTAMAEVLAVINANPGNLLPVFDAILEKSLRLSDAAVGMLNLFDGKAFRLAAERNLPAALIDFAREAVPEPGSLSHRLVMGERAAYLADVRDDEAYRAGVPSRVAMVDLAGARSLLLVALRKDDVLLGGLNIYRTEVRPFTPAQIALVESFAAQAVIAMENARLLNEVQQRQEELRITFENMGDGVALFDAAPALVAWNRNFQDILDLPDDAVHQSLAFADYIRLLAERGEYGHGANAEDHVARLTALLGSPARFERTRPNGRIIEVRQNPIQGGGFVVIYADITERKRNEEALRAARDAAEMALRDLQTTQARLIQAEKMASLGQLTAGIAHEIKNPLNFINNFAALSVELLDELKEATAPGFAALDDTRRTEIDDVSGLLTGNLEKIVEHGKRADNIVRGMLEHSRGSTGERRVVDLNELVEEALSLAYHGARARDQSFNITLERDFADGISPIDLAPQDVTRVLLNLFSNGFYAARKRQQIEPTPGFEPTLRIVTRDLGGAAEIRVRDNGIGIPDEIKARLFQPFFTTKPTGEGTGLGLSISYDIVTQQHGGGITVESQLGEYSEFTVRLPRGR